MLKTILIVVVVLIGGVLAMAATKPDTFSVQRSASIKAPPEKIFAVVNDFHRWPDWSPWEKLDPGMKRTQSGAPAGKGAVYEWDGNSKAGAGRMTINAVEPDESVTIALEFIKPFKSTSTTVFTLEPDGATVVVRWRMTGPKTFMTRFMGVFMSMDKMVGPDFEKGLTQLKDDVEAS